MKISVPKLLLITLALATAVFADAQWSPPPPMDTVDLPAANAVTIVTGTLNDVKPGEGDWTHRKLVVMVQETLKGEAHGKTTIPVRCEVSDENFTKWEQDGDLLLIAVPRNSNENTTFIDLSSKDLAVFTADLKLLRKPEEVLQAVRDRVRATKGAPPVGRYVRYVPVSKIAGTSLEKGAYVNRDKDVRFSVPLDERLEKYGKQELDAHQVRQRLEGIQILAHFKSDDNIEALKALLNDNSWEFEITTDRNKLLAFRRNNVREQAYQLLKTFGVPVEEPITIEPTDRIAQVVSGDITKVDPVGEDLDEFLKYPNLKDLSLSGVRLRDQDLEKLGRLKALQLLYLQSSDISDDKLKRLPTLPNLAYLDLQDTAVTDAGILELARFPRLKKIDLSQLCTEAGIQALHDRRPDILAVPDLFAVLAPFHPRRTEIGMPVRGVSAEQSEPTECWQYAMVFPPETANKGVAFLEKTLLQQGWTIASPLLPHQIKLHRQIRPLEGPVKEWLTDEMNIFDPSDGEASDHTFGLPTPPGARLVLIARTFQTTEGQ